VAKRKPSTIKLQVFKGREAKLNKAIFHTLAQKGPQTIYDIHKQVKTRSGLRYTKYTNVNRRIRGLEESGFIGKVGVRKTLAGFQATIYDLTVRAYLALSANQISIDKFIQDADQSAIVTVLGALASQR